MSDLLEIPAIPSSVGDVTSIRHPAYATSLTDWKKWRLSYEAGDAFKREYLVKLSSRETDLELSDRRKITYVPAFAASAINDIKNAIFQRTNDVTREEGAKSYQTAITGKLRGVDLENSAMGTFIGTEIIHELLVMSKVGILVDNFTDEDLGDTLRDKDTLHPYVTRYKCEDILSWHKNEKGFSAVLLREAVEIVNAFGLPEGVKTEYRLLQQVQDGVQVTFFNMEGQAVRGSLLNIERIPFALMELPNSLMELIADYQIALMNMESSDINFIMKANFPFYYEFYDPNTEALFNKGPSEPDNTATAAENRSRDREVEISATRGRRLDKSTPAPGFVAPPSNTLEAAMKKEDVVKKDIRSLLNLNLQQLDPRRQSAESKEKDEGGLENSLSYIGLILQRGEQAVAEHWSAFENQGQKVIVEYPKTYSLKSESQRRAEAKELEELADRVPSDTFRREVKKIVARTIIGTQVTQDVMSTVEKEIQDATTLTADANIILSGHKSGLIDDITASEAIGLGGEDVVEQAKKDRAERIALLAEAQGVGEGDDNAGERGVPELDKGTPEDEKEGKPKRGKADNTDKGREQK
jgi:hypothetical protein